MCSPFSHLSMDVSIAHVDTISLVKFAFAQTLLIGGGRSVENEIEISADIKTRALLSRGSTDIYADICTVYISNSMSFSTVCRQFLDFSAGVGSVTSAPKYRRHKSASSPKIVLKII